MTTRSEHIAIKSDENGKAVTYCGSVVPFGQWKAGAAYQGLRILGDSASQWCVECQREWIRAFNAEVDT